MEPLAYYFGIKPDEFWNGEYSQINLYLQVNVVKMLDDFKSQIMLQEAVTDKMIRADALGNRRPKVISLKKIFANLYPKEPKIKYQSPQEQLERLRKLK